MTELTAALERHKASGLRPFAAATAHELDITRPAGAYVIRNGDITWRPAYDVNRMVTAVGMIAIIYLMSRPRVARAQAARRQR